MSPGQESRARLEAEGALLDGATGWRSAASITRVEERRCAAAPGSGCSPDLRLRVAIRTQASGYTTAKAHLALTGEQSGGLIVRAT